MYFSLSVQSIKVSIASDRANLIHNSVSSRHRRDSAMAGLLTGIVLMFLFCHFTKLITNIYEAYQMLKYGELRFWPQWADLLSKWNHFMLAVNSSVNIFIYVIKVRLISCYINPQAFEIVSGLQV